MPSSNSKISRSSASGRRLTSRSRNRKSGTTISRTRSPAGSTARISPSAALAGRTPESTNHVKKARIITQCVRIVFGARPAASIL